jgi:hypothetical protein
MVHSCGGGGASVRSPGNSYAENVWVRAQPMLCTGGGRGWTITRLRSRSRVSFHVYICGSKTRRSVGIGSAGTDFGAAIADDRVRALGVAIVPQRPDRPSAPSRPRAARVY